MSLVDADSDDKDWEQWKAEDWVDRDENSLDEASFKHKVDIFISVIVTIQEVSRADTTRMTPSPHLHQDEKDDADWDIGREEHITAPKEDPFLQVKANLGEDGTNERQ